MDLFFPFFSLVSLKHHFYNFKFSFSSFIKQTRVTTIHYSKYVSWCMIIMKYYERKWHTSTLTLFCIKENVKEWEMLELLALWTFMWRVIFLYFLLFLLKELSVLPFFMICHRFLWHRQVEIYGRCVVGGIFWIFWYFIPLESKHNSSV